MNMGKRKMMLSVICLMGIYLCVPMTVIAGSDTPAPVNASDFIKGLDIVGDLQLRYDYADTDKPGDEAADRERVRFRLGMIWDNPEENWKIAAGLTTGGLDANSVHSTYSNEKVFETGDIRLDYAYAEHNLNQFKILAGQQKNPFVTSWALWDSDVRPAGFTGTVDLSPVFLTAGVYQARYVDKDIARMEAVQAGLKNDMLTAAIAFYNYHRIDEYIVDGAKVIINEDGSVGSVPDKYLIDAAMDNDYTYQIVDFYVSGNIAADAVLITPYAQVFGNLGAEGEKGQSIQGSRIGVLDPVNDPEKIGVLDPKKGGALDPEEENLGYVVGVDAKIDRFKMGVAWAQIGADSVMQDLKEGNFGAGIGSTDTEGFKLNLTYALTRHFSVTGTAYLYEAMERDLDQDARIYQVDLDYKF